MKKGICHICGKYSNLTFEHLPPQKAFNNHKVKMYGGEEIFKQMAGINKPWDYSNLKYKYEQKGVGLHTLCSQCNNITGQWYAPEYIKISNSILNYIYDKDITSATGCELHFKGFYPLRFIKQIITMFASTLPEKNLDKNNELKSFILEKDNNILDKNKYRITMYIIKNTQIAWTGINIIGKSNPVSIKTVAYLDLYPLGFEFEFNPSGEAENLDITNFATDFKYNDKVDIGLLLNTRERNTLFPCDYRTKEKIENQSKKSKENHIKIMCDKIINNRNTEEINNLINKYKNDKITSAEFSLEMGKFEK